MGILVLDEIGMGTFMRGESIFGMGILIMREVDEWKKADINFFYHFFMKNCLVQFFCKSEFYIRKASSLIAVEVVYVLVVFAL